MTNAILNKMNLIQISASVLVLLISISEAIRVDWNTNKGPIVPPVPTQPPRPQQPYREPAPVWEDQSIDVPNPNPYSYVLPPPSRPRPAVDNYLRAPVYAQNLQPQQQPPRPNYGKVVSNSVNYQSSIVPSLGVQYIPNVGYKYSAVVPQQKSYYLQQNDIYDHKYEKPNGRYNAKLKKYKEYEQKLKYFPQNNQQVNQYQYAVQPQQQLPFSRAPQPFKIQNFSQQQLPTQQTVQFNNQLNNAKSQQQPQQQQHQPSQSNNEHSHNQQWNQQNTWQPPLTTQYQTYVAQAYPNPTQPAHLIQTTKTSATASTPQPQNLVKNHKQS